jgi:hypothetical protein
VTKAYDLLAMRHCVISVSSQQYHIRVQSIISSKERWTVSQTMSSQRWLINNKGKMKVFVCGLILLGVVRTANALAMSTSGNSGVTETTTRRAFFVTAGSTAAVAAAAMAMPLSAAAAVDVSEFTTTESGLLYKVTKEGTGAIPGAGQMVKAHYTGWLDDFDSEKKFDSSRDRNKPDGTNPSLPWPWANEDSSSSHPVSDMKTAVPEASFRVAPHSTSTSNSSTSSKPTHH